MKKALYICFGLLNCLSITTIHGMETTSVLNQQHDMRDIRKVDVIQLSQNILLDVKTVVGLDASGDVYGACRELSLSYQSYETLMRRSSGFDQQNLATALELHGKQFWWPRLLPESAGMLMMLSQSDMGINGSKKNLLLLQGTYLVCKLVYLFDDLRFACAELLNSDISTRAERFSQYSSYFDFRAKQLDKIYKDFYLKSEALLLDEGRC